MDADDGAAGMPASSLMKYCIDKTALARESSSSSIVGREGEHRMMVEILGRHSRPNVLITGDPGVGKTALVDGLAWDIVNKKVPSFLEDVVLYEFFFFQAEDGIRDLYVTGVQTCALPIFPGHGINAKFTHPVFAVNAMAAALDAAGMPFTETETESVGKLAQEFADRDRARKIGRASCRERV